MTLYKFISFHSHLKKIKSTRNYPPIYGILTKGIIVLSISVIIIFTVVLNRMIGGYLSSQLWYYGLLILLTVSVMFGSSGVYFFEPYNKLPIPKRYLFILFIKENIFQDKNLFSASPFLILMFTTDQSPLVWGYPIQLILMYITFKLTFDIVNITFISVPKKYLILAIIDTLLVMSWNWFINFSLFTVLILSITTILFSWICKHQFYQKILINE